MSIMLNPCTPAVAASTVDENDTLPAVVTSSAAVDCKMTGPL